MPDTIELRGVSARGRHGWFPEEQETGQLFVVDLRLEVDTRPAAHSDDLGDTVDYGALAEAVVTRIEGPPVRLLETLAAQLADVCLDRPGVGAVELSVHKPEAPIPATVGDVVVTIRRTRA